MQIAILWPSFALVALVIIVWFGLFAARIGHIRRNPPRPEDFATGDDAMRYFQPVEMPANNFRNLFEMPVLYFALVPLLMITHQANGIQVALAWAYVAARVLHSFVHVILRKVPLRALIYWVSSAILMAMWIGFFVDMVAVAQTLDGIGRP